MDCPSCNEQQSLLATAKEENFQLTMQVMAKDEMIRTLQAEVQMIGAKYRDMLWQRNALHEITMSEQSTIRYRQITNGQ